MNSFSDLFQAYGRGLREVQKGTKIIFFKLDEGSICWDLRKKLGIFSKFREKWANFEINLVIKLWLRPYKTTWESGHHRSDRCTCVSSLRAWTYLSEKLWLNRKIMFWPYPSKSEETKNGSSASFAFFATKQMAPKNRSSANWSQIPSLCNNQPDLLENIYSSTKYLIMWSHWNLGS